MVFHLGISYFAKEPLWASLRICDRWHEQYNHTYVKRLPIGGSLLALESGAWRD